MLKRFLTGSTVATFFLTLLMAAPAWAQPELSITKDGPATVEPGQRFVYTLIVENTGDDPATGVVVTDRLPPGVQFIEADGAACTESSPDTQNRITVTCTIPTLDDQDSETIELIVRAPNRAGVIENRATVDSTETDEETSNTVQTTVAPDVEINKLDDPDPVRREGLLLYTLRVTNQGSRATGDIVIIDDLPVDEVDLARPVQSDDFTCTEDAGFVRCTGSLDRGETGTVDIFVEPEDAGTLENSAEVRAGRLLIDTATESTTVVAGGRGDGTTTGTGTTGTGTGTTGTGTTGTGTTTGGTGTTTAGTGGTGTTGTGTGGAAAEEQYAKDVIESSIPKKVLPNTGGASLLLGLAAFGFASVVVGASVLRAGTRRRR